MIEDQPDLTTSSNNTTDASGLYKSTDTNSGSPTYYFRGNVENNYVDFADFTWRVVRINEDGTVRLIMSEGINDETGYVFNTTRNNYKYIYYSNGSVKTQLESWYTSNITENGYGDYVKSGDYFCQQAKVEYASSYTTGSATPTFYKDYIPNFKCENDGNGYGLINSNIGLLNYDEVIHAGGYYLQNNTSYYLYYTHGNWIMSPSGYYDSIAREWLINSDGKLASLPINGSYRLRPVINLKADVTAIGSGTSVDPYVVK